jgi:hypothetical protein
MVSSDRGDRHAGNAASGNQLGFELGAVSAATTAGLGELVVGVHVSTIYEVDTMLLDLGYRSSRVRQLIPDFATFAPSPSI